MAASAAAIVVSALALCAAGSGVAAAAPGTLTYLKEGNVFVSAADGSATAQVTRDGSPAAPYVLASQSASGVVVAVRNDTAFRLAQSGQQIAAPVSLPDGATGGGGVSPDGRTLAYGGVELCGIAPQRACNSTFFRSLETGGSLLGNGTQMRNPVWASDAEVIGSVACGIYRAAPGRTAFQEWVRSLSDLGLGSGCIQGAAASADGQRLVVAGAASLPTTMTLYVMTAPGFGGIVTPRCEQSVPVPGPEPHPVWSPDGTAIAWEEADGIWTQSIVDLSGTDIGCQANSATALLIAPGGIRPSWSPAPYDPRPVAIADGAQRPQPGPKSAQPRRNNTSSVASLRLRSTPRLRAALREGLTVVVTCRQRCTARGTATVDQRTARRFGLGRRATTVAQGSRGRLQAGRSGPLKLRFTTRARQGLRRASRVKLTVAVRIRLGTGEETRRTTVTLHR